MLFVFRIVSPALACGTPASDLDGSDWTFNDLSLESATKRAYRRLDSTFSYSTAARVAATSMHHVATFESMTAYKKACDSAYDSGVSLDAFVASQAVAS